MAPRVAAPRNADEWKLALGIDPFDDEARVRLEAQLLALTQRLLTLGTSVILEMGLLDSRRAG